MVTRRRYIDDGAVAVEERFDTEVRAHAETAASESETVSSHVGPADTARAWVRWTQALMAFGLLVLEAALTFRLIFALTGSNPANGFVKFIYDITGPFVAPFENIANEQVNGNGVFEPETMIAMAVYAVAALLIIAFVGLIANAPGPHTKTVVRDKHAHFDGQA